VKILFEDDFFNFFEFLTIWDQMRFYPYPVASRMRIVWPWISYLYEDVFFFELFE
jgi:hypothetical protein